MFAALKLSYANKLLAVQTQGVLIPSFKSQRQSMNVGLNHLFNRLFQKICLQQKVPEVTRSGNKQSAYLYLYLLFCCAVPFLPHVLMGKSRRRVRQVFTLPHRCWWRLHTAWRGVRGAEQTGIQFKDELKDVLSPRRAA